MSAFSRLRVPFPKFTQIMGECSSKEWIARVSSSESDGEYLWALLKVGSLRDSSEELEDQFIAELFEHCSDIDWLSGGIHPLEMMIDQCFLSQLPVWSKMDRNPIELIHEAALYVALTC